MDAAEGSGRDRIGPDMVVVSTCGRYSVVVWPVDIGATRVFLTEHSADIWVLERSR